MRVQVITPFHWDGVLRVRGDVLSGESAEQIADDAHYAALVTPLADEPSASVWDAESRPDLASRYNDAPASHVVDVPQIPASAPVSKPDVKPSLADDHHEE